MTATENVSNFVKSVMARIQGDDSKVVALHNERKAQTAIDSQISSLVSKQVDDEELVREAQEELHAAKYPTTKITDNKLYIQNIVAAQKKLDTAEETLKQTNDSIEFYKNLKKNIGF